MKKYLIPIILVFLNGCSSVPKNNLNSKYHFCQYPSVNCDEKGNCIKKDPRLKDVGDFCMPLEIIKALELRGYE